LILNISEIKEFFKNLIDFDSLAEVMEPVNAGNAFAPIEDLPPPALEKLYLKKPGGVPEL